LNLIFNIQFFLTALVIVVVVYVVVVIVVLIVLIVLMADLGWVGQQGVGYVSGETIPGSPEMKL
jgi:hypothetical protein